MVHESEYTVVTLGKTSVTVFLLLFALINGYPQLLVHSCAKSGTFHHRVMRVPGYATSVPEVVDDAGVETIKEMLPGERKTGSEEEADGAEIVLVATGSVTDSVVVAIVVAPSETVFAGAGVGTDRVGGTVRGTRAGIFVGTGVAGGTYLGAGAGAGETVRSSAGVEVRNTFSIFVHQESACACVAKIGVSDAPSMNNQAKNNFFIGIFIIPQKTRSSVRAKNHTQRYTTYIANI